MINIHEHIARRSGREPLFCNPNCYTWAAIAVGAATAIATTVYSQVSQPTPPNLAAGSKAISDANAALLPVQRQLQAAAQEGKKVTVSMPDGKGGSTKQTYDFTGYSTADANAKVADVMAKSTLALQQQFDPQFINQALQQEALADPQGMAAKAQESKLIQQQVNATPDRPVADLLEKQVGDELKASQNNQLDPMMKGVLDDAVGKAQSARGGSGNDPTADFEAPLTTGFAGQQRQMAANQKALSLLTSGVTPEDVDYRREQQNLSNLSSEVSGATPESQFKNLSGAQQGATPTGTTQANLNQLPTNASQVAASGQINQYQAQLNSTPSWMAGLTSLLSAGSAAVKATP